LFGLKVVSLYCTTIRPAIIYLCLRPEIS